MAIRAQLLEGKVAGLDARRWRWSTDKGPRRLKNILLSLRDGHVRFSCRRCVMVDMKSRGRHWKQMSYNVAADSREYTRKPFPRRQHPFQPDPEGIWQVMYNLRRF